VNTREWSDWSCAVLVTTTDAADLDRAVDQVHRVMSEVEAAASRFREDSDLARINAAAGRFVSVSALTLDLVGLSLDVAERTAGAVTPTVGAALERLGYDADIEVVAARDARDARDARGARDAGPAEAPCAAPSAAASVRLDHELRRVGVGRGVRIDLGALAKAYAVDEALRRIGPRADGAVLVGIGGDLCVHGAPVDGWPIAVSETAGGPAETVMIEFGALATSSTMGRRWAGGRHHIVDPRTGHSTDGPWRTATVWAPTAVEANILSTWLLVDAEAAERALAADPRPVRAVTSAGVVRAQHGWPVEEAIAS